MNPRERNLLVVLIAIVGTAVSAYGGWQWFVVPLREYNAKIQELTDETDRLELQQTVFGRERKRLELGRLKSLPYKEADAQAEYEPYLKKVLQDNKLSYDSITKVAAIKVKMAAPISGIKEPGHQTMQFTINRARGELKQIVSALETIQRTPYEHRVKSMTIDRAQSGFAKTDRLLIVTLTLEVMLVAKTENKVGDILANSKLRDAVRLPQGRDYALINERNIFIGAEENIVKNLLPPEKIKKQEVIFLPPEKGPERAKIDIEVWKHVRMSQTTPDRDEVHFRNIAYESPEFVVVANKKGYDTYRVMTEDKKHEFCNFKVLRVDLHQIYLQVRDQVHVMQFRQSLFEALQTPATERQLFWAGVKADARWGEEEKSKAKNPFVGKFPPRGKGK